MPADADLLAELDELKKKLAIAEGKKKNQQLTMETGDHGTPVDFIELVRYTLGELDLDPSSSAYWNHHTVKAKRFYDERDNFLAQPLYGRIIWNPPGGKCLYKGKNRSLPRAAWEMLVDHHRDGRVHSAVYIGYSMEQLVQLQNAPVHPLQFITFIPRERIEFLTRPPGGGPPVVGDSPTHGNFITLLHTNHSASVAREQVGRFIERANSLTIGGAVVRPI